MKKTDRRRFLLAGGAASVLPLAAACGAGSSSPAAERSFVLPPTAGDDQSYLRKCIRCYRCVAVCQVGAIRTLPSAPLAFQDVPVIVPREQACTLCMGCTEVCPSGALKPLTSLKEMRRKKVSMGTAKIDAKRCIKISGRCTCQLCLPTSRSCICRICYDICPLPEEAITLEKRTLHPKILAEGCVGCGLCAQYCPEDAISVERKKA